MSSESYHEPYEKLSPQTLDLHRAIQSLKEELDAVDWYQQRVDATSDAELRAILAHNRDEEKEHASMVLEWIRRRDAVFAATLRTYLFTQGDVTAIEEEVEGQGSPKREASPSAPPQPHAAGQEPPQEVNTGERRSADEVPHFTVGGLKPR